MCVKQMSAFSVSTIIWMSFCIASDLLDSLYTESLQMNWAEIGTIQPEWLNDLLYALQKSHCTKHWYKKTLFRILMTSLCKYCDYITFYLRFTGIDISCWLVK